MTDETFEASAYQSIFVKLFSNRYRAMQLLLACFLITSTAARVILVIANFSQLSDSWLLLFPALGIGFCFDLIAGLWLLLPFSFFLLAAPDRWFSRRAVLWTCQLLLFVFIFSLLYLGAAEYFFFDEFSARFNTVAVDYLIYPHEIFVNMWETLPLAKILAATFLIAGSAFVMLRKRFLSLLILNTSMRVRFLFFGAHFLLLTIVCFGWDIRYARISDNRVINELALNGLYSFGSAARTKELDYDQFYARLPDSTEAFSRLRRILSADGSRFIDSADQLSIDRLIVTGKPPRPLNVVIILEESFGSKFIKSLDSTGPGVATEFEKLADNGLLFTHIYATGNRTVRGIEAILASFPPLPGESIVRRPGGRNVFTISALLKSFGYSTAFIYGGLAYFDNMGDFTSSNGFEQVLDRTNFTKKTFTTIWGVCDEDLFDNSLIILDSLHRENKPFFSLLLTVSNHSPYTFPDGRIPTNPKEHTRENAVRYADYSLSKFLHDAESHQFFDSTIFIVVADHGARIYGSQEIPMDSYEIPLLFYAPKIIKAGQRNNTLGSQMDVAPTIMALLQFQYMSQFFGHDLLSAPKSAERALMNHNRDIALYSKGKLAVLGLKQRTELWKHDSASGDFSPLPISEDSSFVLDAVAYFQGAYYLFSHRKLHPPDQSPQL
ncbi:MAG: sulfatase-like hydrolase/transferase [candidate division Zixibacteria bacterium]|nr:sulfatase-like hydrolase/transferase [candidate division Zixibacteria bacterium]